MNINPEFLRKKLKTVFGYSHFRRQQEEIIMDILEEKNTFIIMPTGAGKSMCYQLPALMMKGTAIVISPLIALMKNQVDQLNILDVKAEFLNSTLLRSKIKQIMIETMEQRVKLLYMAPESLIKPENIDFLRGSDVSFFAIDEAHCISEWGHDFRPEYRKIRDIIDQIKPSVPIMALTATATVKVRQDIQRTLRIEDANVFLSSFHRKNLFYEVQPKTNSRKQLIRFLTKHKGKSGIIYCSSRKKVEQIAGLLQVNDFKALPYHAGMESSVRSKTQDAFINEDIDIIVATIAFGMGIDKPDVRFIVHYDAPKSIEGYYQETGRAGRDGLNSFCLMLFSPKDITKLEKFNKTKTVTEIENTKHLLQEVCYYATSSVCRHRQLLYYFGEYLEKDFGFCDNVYNRKREEFAADSYVIAAINTALQTGENFDVSYLAKVIVGDKENKYIKSYGHNKLEVFGKGKSETQSFWKSIIRQCMISNLLRRNMANIKIIELTKKGRFYLKNPYNIIFSKDYNYEAMTYEKDNNNDMVTPQVFDKGLFEILRSLRKKIAKEKKFPPYIIFLESSLEEMATTYPTTKQELAQVNGVGMGKVEKFGKPFIDTINKYVKENDIITASEVVIKSAINKSRIKIYIIHQIDRKVDFEDIAENKGISYEELIGEVENICYSGVKLNIDYYINQVLEREKQKEIYEYFLHSESDNVHKALKELKEERYDLDDIRLMRIKFLSDHSM